MKSEMLLTQIVEPSKSRFWTAVLPGFVAANFISDFFFPIFTIWISNSFSFHCSHFEIFETKWQSFFFSCILDGQQNIILKIPLSHPELLCQLTGHSPSCSQWYASVSREYYSLGNLANKVFSSNDFSSLI